MGENMGKILIAAAIVLLITGILFTFNKNIPFGRLPGDIRIVKEGFSFYFPITTCIILSIIFSIIFFLIGKK
jgi:hypothetical protein